MIRLLLFPLFVCLAACGANTAEISCGKSVCASNQRCEATLRVCVLDEPPTLVIDAPSNKALVTGDTLSVRGSVVDDGAVSSLELSIDDGKTWSQVGLSGNRFDARVALPVLDAEPLAISLRAHDAHLQGATAKVAVTVDNVAPQVTVASPTPGAKLNAAWFAGTGAVSGLVIDGSSDVSVSVDVGNGPRSTPVNGGQFSDSWQVSGEDGVVHAVRITAVDRAGNQTVVEQTVTVDVVPPAIAFLTPAPSALLGTAFFQGGGLLQGTVSTGATVTVGAQGAAVKGDQWSFAWPLPTGVDFQPQVLEAVATDAAGNQSRARQLVTVDVVPPVLAFSSPAPGAKLNASSFSGGDDVAVAWVVSDGDPQVVVRDGQGIAGPSPLKVTTSPTDNPKAYAVTLSASDRAGNTASVSLAFAVDRLRPSVIARAPADGSRNNPGAASLDFSEPVTGGDGLTLSPAAGGGVWTSPTHFEIAGLASDAVFTAAVGAVSDGFGNPAVIPANTHFHTAPQLPASGATLMNDVWKFKAAADRDGVLSIFSTSQTTPAEYRWVRVNPRTGVVEDHRMPWQPTLGSAFSELDTSAWSSVKPDLSARRVAGAMTLHPGTILERRVWTRFDDAAANSDLGMIGLIPTPAFAAEGPLGEVGELKFISTTASSYLRAGMANGLDVGLAAPTAVGYGDTRWELVEARGGSFKRRSFGCVRHFGNVPPSCELAALQQWNDVSATDNTSYAMAEACSVAIYDTTAGNRVMHVEPYAPTCLGNCPLAWSTTQPLGTELRVAVDHRDTNSFIGAERVATGVQLKRLALNGGCAGSWANVGAPVAVPLGAAFEPVSLGGKPALLFVDAGFALKVVLP